MVIFVFYASFNSKYVELNLVLLLGLVQRDDLGCDQWCFSFLLNDDLIVTMPNGVFKRIMEHLKGEIGKKG